MRYLLIFAIALFVVAPLDAQYAVLSAVRSVWLSPGGQSLIIGAAIGIVATLVYTAGWNGAIDAIYREDLSRAEDARRRRAR